MESSFQLILVFLLTTNFLYPQWVNQNIFPDGGILSVVFFINHNTGWISCGKTHFIDKNIGWSLGRFFKKTTNGSQDWQQLTFRLV